MDMIAESQTPLEDARPAPVVIERQRRQRSRNIAVFVCLLGFVLLVYAVTITKIKLGYGP